MAILQVILANIDNTLALSYAAKIGKFNLVLLQSSIFPARMMIPILVMVLIWITLSYQSLF
jgi:hypothetical protein